jgi:hypothetical protein
VSDYSAFYTDEFMREHRATLDEIDFVKERRRVIRALNQQPCPHCGQPMVASTPAAPVVIDGRRISADDPLVEFCGYPGCGKRVEDCPEHAAWRTEQ